jgi:phosphatidylserine/phosphatidylglycerophosphate/cardiolipin synthase-like enzyme
MVVQAVAGTNVVLLGMNLPADIAAGLLGFAVHRVDHTEGEAYWLPNQLLFRGNDHGANSDWSSEANPIQTFRWGDYSAKPGHDYTYRVVAKGGSSSQLTDLAEVSVHVSTEGPNAGSHSVVFNRGAMASQWYAERFDNKQPQDVPHREAYKWLSRGLEEALLGFIGQASGPEWTLRAALYEFTYAPVLDAFRIAADAGADVSIVVDYVGGPTHDPRVNNEPAISAAGIGNLVTQRKHTKIAHNKFIVACRNGKPVSVWTGSTNISEGGIFGQSNVGHEVRDEKVASAYLSYWEELHSNPMPDALKTINDTDPVVPPTRLRQGVLEVFSPRHTLAALDWYAALAAKAKTGLFLTAAFGVSKELMAVLEVDKPYLRYVLMDTDRGGAELLIRNADPDNQVTVGAPIPRGGWGQWVREVTLGVNRHVRYIHTKYMLIDPLGKDPIVITGSANFSEASTRDNDENMLIIRGNTAVADVYLTEFMRLFTHYEFRANTRTPPHSMTPGPETADAANTTRGRRYLDETPGKWVPRWYAPDSPRARERAMFSGS